MRFSAIVATAFAGLVAASPAATPAPRGEDVTISNFTAREDKTPTGQDVKAVSFTLDGRDATGLSCSASNPGDHSEVITCGDSKYRFAIWGVDGGSFNLRVYHETGLAVGYYGEHAVPTYCHAGGAGPNDFVCSQVNGPLTFHIQ